MEITIQHIPVHYEIYGEGIPVLNIHGFSCDLRLMTGCMEPLFADRPGYQRIYIDLPGMGHTPSAEHINGTDDMLAVVLDFIDAVLGKQPFLLAGESYGGLLSRGIVLRRPEQVPGLALICPGMIADRAQRDLPSRAVIVSNPHLLASLSPTDAENFGSMAVVQDDYNWQRFRDEIGPGVKLADQPFLERILQNYAFTFDVDALPQPYTRPTVFFMGRQDHAVGYRDAWQILENYPRATFAVLDRAGHNAHIEQAVLFNALMGEWLERVIEDMAQER
jgi:pimeloyl-ACP methyl ester carboxylesterase